MKKSKRIVAGLMALAIVMSVTPCMPASSIYAYDSTASSNTTNTSSSASTSKYYYITEQEATNFINSIQTLSNESKAFAIVKYIAKVSNADLSKRNCQITANDVKQLCEDVSIPCFLRFAARNDSYAGNDHVNNAISVDGIIYIADANCSATNPTFERATDYYSFCGGYGISDGQFVGYLDKENNEVTIRECLLFNTSKIVFPSTLKGYKVKYVDTMCAVYNNGFLDKESITELDLSNIEELVGNTNFQNMPNLKKVTLGKKYILCHIVASIIART